MAEQLSLAVRPVWDEIENVRRSVAAFLGATQIDADTTDAMTMVACELTENATKYGAFDQSRQGAVRVDVSIDEHAIVVEVRNPVSDADDAHLQRLDRVVQWIRGYQDPFEAYVERLKEVSGQRLDMKESGLGLVRIAYEGQSVLDFYVDERGVLAVSAIYRR